MNSRNSWLNWVVLVVLIGGVNATYEIGQVVPSEKFLNPPPERMELFSFGFHESIADSLWLRWVQDSDYCQTYLAPVKQVNTTLGDDRLTENPRHKICDNSWGFKMLDAVTNLAPKFWMPYVAGAVNLSVIIEDYEGASIIFDKGLKEYPHDWMLSYRAAYHFLYDRQDLPKAASLLENAAAHGAPEWLKSLAARLYEKEGQLELGLSALESYRKTVTSEAGLKAVDERIANIKKQMSR